MLYVIMFAFFMLYIYSLYIIFYYVNRTLKIHSFIHSFRPELYPRSHHIATACAERRLRKCNLQCTWLRHKLFAEMLKCAGIIVCLPRFSDVHSYISVSQARKPGPAASFIINRAVYLFYSVYERVAGSIVFF